MTLVPASLVLRLAASIAIAGALLLAQDKIRFDPTRDLDGFEACASSEFKELYDLDAYSDLLGKEMTSAELADVRRRWIADVAKGDGEVADLRSDPGEESSYLVRRRMARSSFFSKITYTEVRSVPGFVLFVQRPAADAPDKAASIAAAHGPWLEKLKSVFEAQVAKPLGLSRAPGRALTAVAILASEDDYRRFWSIHPNPGATAPRACYDPLLKIVVSYVSSAPESALADLRYAVLHACVYEQLSAVATSPERRPRSLWIEEGLATFLAWHEGATPACLDERRIRPAELEAVVGLAANKVKGPLVLHPLEELAALKTREDVDALVSKRAEAAGGSRPPQNDVENGFLGESALWVHFLSKGRDGALRPGLLEYVRLALSIDGGPGALRLALKTQDLAALDREFLGWLLAENARVFPQAKIDPAVVRNLFVTRAPRAASESQPATPPR